MEENGALFPETVATRWHAFHRHPSARPTSPPRRRRAEHDLADFALTGTDDARQSLESEA